MDSETKVVYHGATVVDASTSNLPQYSAYPPPPPAAVIHTSNPATVIVAQQVGPQPSQMICRSCHAEIVSRVEKENATKTHLFALGLCLIGCWCCFWIPYYTDSCKNTNHYCPNCNSYIGAYKN